MTKWMCGGCGQVADEQVDHGTGEIAMDWSEKHCGPWFDATHVYRAGQEEMRGQAERKAVTMVGSGKTSHAIRALPLEGDDE